MRKKIAVIGAGCVGQNVAAGLRKILGVSLQADGIEVLGVSAEVVRKRQLHLGL